MRFDPSKVTWHDTSDITLIACMIDDGIEHTEEQYKLFIQADVEPHVLDKETVNRALKLAEEDSVHIEIYEEQLNRWHKAVLTTYQENKINRISQELKKYSEIHQKYFELLEKLSKSSLPDILPEDEITE